MPRALPANINTSQVIEEEGLQENAHNVGTYMINSLRDLKKDSPVIVDVRGKGLMVGMELVENKASCEFLL